MCLTGAITRMKNYLTSEYMSPSSYPHTDIITLNWTTLVYMTVCSHTTNYILDFVLLSPNMLLTVELPSNIKGRRNIYGWTMSADPFIRLIILRLFSLFQKWLTTAVLIINKYWTLHLTNNCLWDWVFSDMNGCFGPMGMWEQVRVIQRSRTGEVK